MSDPGYKYSSYSGQSANNQSLQAYNRLKPPLTSQSHQQTLIQYAHQAPYDGSQQHQSLNVNQGSQLYESMAWKSEQDPSYSYSQRPQASPYNTSNSVASNGYHATNAPPTPTGTNTLNTLAYASDLESVGISNRGTQSENPTSISYNPSIKQAPEMNQAQRTDCNDMNRSHSAASRSQSQAQKSSYQTELQQAINPTMTAIYDGLSRQRAHLQYPNYRAMQSNQAPTNSQRKMPSPTMAYSSSNTVLQSQASNQVKASTPVGHASQPVPSSRWNTQQSQSHSRMPSTQYHTQAQYPTEIVAPNTASTTTRSAEAPYATQYTSHSTPGHAQTQPSRRQDSSRSLVNPGPVSYGASNEKDTFTQPVDPLSLTQNSMPSFIDPSEIFNPYRQEYEKRKALEEAEAEAEAAQLVAEQNRRARERDEEQERQRNEESTTAVIELAREGEKKKSRKSEPNPLHKASNADHRRRSEDNAVLHTAAFLSSRMGPAVEEDNGTVDETQVMFQKIQQMKSQDPSKFQQLLGALMDDQPAPRNSSTSQSSAQIAGGSPFNSTTRPASVPRSISKGDSSKKFHYHPPEGNLENLPDLGKFPTRRRMRKKLHASQEAATEDFVRVPSTGPISTPRSASWSRPRTSTTSPALVQDQSASGFKFSPSTKLKLNSSEPVHTPSTPRISALKASSPRQVPDQVSQSQQSASKQTPLTVCPQATRKVLAEAAARILLSNPLNRDKELSPAVILQFLEPSSSYLELCDKLEARGIALHRGNLARSLLHSVPDMAPSSHAAAITSSVASPTTQALKLQGAPLGQPEAQAVAQLNTTITANSTSFGAPVISKPELESFNSKPSAIPEQPFIPSKSNAQRPPSLTTSMGPKEAQARKRDFSDIVDLTQGLDDDETEDENEPPRKEPRLDDPNTDPRLSFHKPAAPLNLPIKPAPNFESDVPSNRQKEEIARRSSVGNDLVKSLKKTDALRRSSYNILTIARDVLLASGRHPTEPPLNAHLAKLATRLPQLGYDADLSSLRWDVIDPGGPPVLQDESTRISPNQRFTSSGANISGLTTVQLNLMRVANKQRKKQEGQPPKSNLRKVVALTDDVGSARSSIVTVQVPQRTLSPPSPISGSIHKATPRNAIKPSRPMPPADSGSAPKRRGRPPGAKNMNPLKSQQPRQAAKVVIPVPRRPKDTLKRRSPEPISYNTYDCRWEGCQAKLHNLGTLRKHFAKVHHYNYDRKSCLWEGCGTENGVYDKPSNTSKTMHVPFEFNSRDDWSEHVVSAHLDPIGWSLGEGPSTRSNDSSSSVPTYLLDESGRLVTPMIKADSGRPQDTMHFVKPTLESEKTIDRKGIVAFNKAHGNNTPSDKAKEVLRAVERKKATIGALIDRGGCTMVNRNNRHILGVGGDVKIVHRADEWLFEGRETDMDTQESDEC